MDNYKKFRSQEFVGRKEEIDAVEKALQERAKNVIIFEGDRGVGKTSLLLSLFKRLNAAGPGVKPFFLSLFEYRADEFKEQTNCWIKDEKFNPDAISKLLDQIAGYFEMPPVRAEDPDTKKEYLARGLALLPGDNLPVLFVDSIYECAPDLREQLEKYLLLPFISSERSILILSGRGGAPAWSHPALRFADVKKLQPFEGESPVRDQLEKMESPHMDAYREIAAYSAGYPLMVRLLGQGEGAPQDELDGAIDILLGETLLSENYSADFSAEEQKQLRLQVEKLSLVALPFRKIEVQDYIFKDDPERPAKTTTLIETLLRSHIMRYENGGYQLNASIADPIRKYLTLPKGAPKLKEYIALLQKNCNELGEAYPAAKPRYDDLIELIKPYQAHLG